MTYFQHSIKKNLILWLICPILFLGILQGVFAYYLGSRYANHAFDESLEDLTGALSKCLHIKHGKVVLDLPPASMSLLAFDEDDKFYYVIQQPNGNRIAGNTPTLYLNHLDKIDATTYRDSVIDDQTVRIATKFFHIQSANESKDIFIQVAKESSEQQNLIKSIFTSVIFPQSLLVLFVLTVVILGVNKGLEPLDKLRKALLEQNPENLKPINEEHTPQEVLPFVAAINSLLARTSNYVMIHKRFVANSAHQLKTPLAGLMAQTELAMTQNNPDAVRHALSLIYRSATRSSRLIGQLLSLSRMEPEALNQMQKEPVDLVGIAQQVIGDFVFQAREKDIKLGLEVAESTPIMIQGFPGSIYEMMSNLIDNAIRYTQPHGSVSIQIKESEEGSVFTVNDNGPGIPEDKQQQVFERFYRISEQASEGSGLGLAIVQEIAKIHNAQITFQAAAGVQGTCICVCFPSLP